MLNGPLGPSNCPQFLALCGCRELATSSIFEGYPATHWSYQVFLLRWCWLYGNAYCALSLTCLFTLQKLRRIPPSIFQIHDIWHCQNGYITVRPVILMAGPSLVGIQYISCSTTLSLIWSLGPVQENGYPVEMGCCIYLPTSDLKAWLFSWPSRSACWVVL